MKKAILFLIVLFTANCYAQSDFEIAQEFMSKKGVELVPNKSSATRGTDVPYSIFNGSDGKGFCIVVNDFVVAYDIESTVDENNLPCCLKEMLGNYSRIKTRGLTERKVKVIEPIIRTKWNQSSPYNDSVSQKTNICGYVAEAQILHYLKVDFYGEGHFFVGDKPVDLYPTTFDHDLIGMEGEEGWAEETARFFKYSMHGSSLIYFNYKFEEIFGVRREDITFGEYESRYRIYDMLLESGKPMVVNSPNHWFIIDGRDSEGRYHVNFGWGGYCDGYYSFPDTKNDKQYFDSSFEYNSETKYKVQYYIPLTESTKIITSTIIQPANTVYNLQGIKMGNSLDGLPKGIYIQNGKKIMKN